MPIVDVAPPSTNFAVDTPQGFAVTPFESDINQGSEGPSAGEVYRAAFRLDNTIGSVRADLTGDMSNEDDGTNPWDDIKNTYFEPQWKRFVDARNQKARDLIKEQIMREEEDRKTLAAAPLYQSVPAQIAAGTIDLPTLLPAGSLIRGVRGGYSVARSALSTGAAAAVGAGVQEGVLHSTQQTRTLEESGVNVGASFFLGGLLGAGGAKLLSNVEWNRAVQNLERELAGQPAATFNAPGSAGAAAVEPMDIEGNAIAGKAASAVAAATARLNPALRLLQSPSAATRETATKLFENSLYLKKNFEDIASEPAVETLMKEWNAGLAKSITSTDDAYAEYRKTGGQFTREQFREAVGKAMRRGDSDDDPYIASVAKDWRESVFEPLKVKAVEAGLLPKDVSVETAASYFSRMWNRNKLVAQEGRFKAIVENWVAANAPKWAEAFDKKAEAQLAPLQREIDYQEITKLRRVEELRQRNEGGEVDAGEFGESDIRAALRIVEGGAPRPKGVKTLTQYLVDIGGLVDHGGELRSMGITPQSRPGLIRAERRRIGPQNKVQSGGYDFDTAAQRAWEDGYFPDHVDGPPTAREFLDALSDDFSKRRAVVRQDDMEAYRLIDLVNQLEQDLARIGVTETKGVRFSTSEEVKGMVARVYAALDARANAQIADLKAKLTERKAKLGQERDARFVGDPKNLGRSIADDVFDALTGKTGDATRPEFINVKARGPLKERTFNIPDDLVEDFLESDVEIVGRRYTRIMGADVEMAGKFGSTDMAEQIQKIRDSYKQLRSGLTDEKALNKLGEQETADIRDIEALRDLLRGTRIESPIERNYGRIFRMANMVNYIRSMGEVVWASLTDAVRPAMVHGLAQYMETVPKLLAGAKGVKLSIGEAKLAGNVTERVLAQRLGTIAEIVDPYASRSPVEAFLENGTNIASKWNGIRIWTDMMQAVASVMTQDRIIKGVLEFGGIKPKERAYLAYLGIDQSMAERIAKQFNSHGETVDGVRVANTESWTDPVAVRTYRAAMNKDVDSIIVQKSVADVPLFANTPTGRLLLQFKTFALASHQRILLRGLQEDQTRFLGGLVSMTAMGMLITYLKAVSGNRTEKQSNFFDNPGWWIGEGLDRSGVLSIPMEIANTFERATGLNPIKSPMKMFDEDSAQSQKMQNRNEVGALLGPSAGLAQDIMNAGGIPKRVAEGEEITQGQKNAAERLLPFNSYAGMRQLLRYVVNAPE